MKRISVIKNLIILLLLAGSCKHKPSGLSETTKNSSIHIQPLGDFPSEQANYVLKELNKMYPKVMLHKAIELPAAAYYKPRNRYRADSIIRILLRSTEMNNVTIALTDKDISTTKGMIEDYGIMGLGYQPGRSCVVSTFRLKKQNLKSQLFTVAVHELGHTRGLPHCSVNTCYMRDAEGKNYIDEETGFCKNCKKHLSERGWKIK